ncbi:MAG: hypothetical protein KME06_13800 [Kastovskya adunca ATA6-11-RM4]|nr:hypothetical protein [Kastovskya adunca ATA6-11-RM4]
MLGSSAGGDLVAGKGFFPAIVSAQGSSHSLMSKSDGVTLRSRINISS